MDGLDNVGRSASRAPYLNDSSALDPQCRGGFDADSAAQWQNALNEVRLDPDHTTGDQAGTGFTEPPPPPPAGQAAAAPSTASPDAVSAAERDKAARAKLAAGMVRGDSSTSPADAKLVAGHMAATMPLKEMQALHAAGITVRVTTGDVTTYLPQLKADTPRGHPPGSTWQGVPGTYWGPTKEIIIATQAGAHGQRALPGQNQSSSDDVFLHEAAHAYNRTGASGMLSDQADFKAADAADAATGRLAQPYYHQKDASGRDTDGGRDEAFAESSAIYATHPQQMQAQYPHLYAYWQNHVGH